MADAGQQFVTEVAVIDDLSFRGNFAERSLKSDAVGTHVLQQPFPPVRTFFHDLVELRFRNSVAPAGLEKFRSAHTTVAQNAGNSFRQFLATARCALINGDNGHETIPSYRAGSGPAPENFLSNSKCLRPAACLGSPVTILLPVPAGSNRSSRSTPTSVLPADAGED